MQRKRILFLGYGDIGARAALQLQEHELVGVARSPKNVPEQVSFMQAAADSMPVCERLLHEHWDALVITLTPTEFSDRAYDIGYVQTMRRLLEYIGQNPPGIIFFLSSTSVYPQTDGQWVDEQTSSPPVSFSGKRLLEAEQLLRDSGLQYCVLRVAGIYGPGRNVLIRQVRQGQGGSDAYTNRVHAEDCAGFLVHLIQRHFDGQDVEPMYLVSDGNPVSGRQIREWLAQEMGLAGEDLIASVSERGGNKRCRNERMLATGYQLLYPDYKVAYREILESMPA